MAADTSEKSLTTDNIVCHNCPYPTKQVELNMIGSWLARYHIDANKSLRGDRSRDGAHVCCADLQVIGGQIENAGRSVAARDDVTWYATKATMTDASPPRLNNFDAIRIVAALQVLLVHGYEHFKLREISPVLDVVFRALQHIPGVPIFFTVSGFLITWSFDRSPAPTQYVRNRLLRVYPGLCVALMVTFVVLVAHGLITPHNITSRPVMAWLAGQLTIGQFYTPALLRGYGLGNPNGALWTIVVELQFYAFVPIIIVTVKTLRQRNTILIVVFLLSLAFNLWLSYRNQAAMTTKLLRVTVVPYLFFFITGALAYFNWSRVAGLVVGRAPWALLAFVAYSAIASETLHLYVPSYWPNGFGVVAALLLSLTTLSFAFSWPGFSGAALRGQDLSYGIYIYHCIVLNFMVHHGYVRRASWLFVLVAVSAVLAALSWRWVEAPALKRKKHALTREAPSSSWLAVSSRTD